ncbi:Wadjet anti-phage system protein JetA family protein [Gudongella sp. DL1XJH-153]|uniref:Wadjet anti-phage system protein JetA family protein n=1 Tax=Gudongella sp. DL1XJH-153 TaxID=3409804 RepID=UPI003BB586D3
MQLFKTLSDDFFKPLTSKYKDTYVDCLEMIYETYRTEFSFGVEREVLLGKLEQYFDEKYPEEMVFDEEEISVTDSRSKANAVLRHLRNCGWVEYEHDSSYNVKVNLHDYAATIIEALIKVDRNEEMEYQSEISSIYGILMNQEGFRRPYENVIKKVIENTEYVMVGLKKLNTSIKNRIDNITRDKTASEIVRDFFDYNIEIGSKSYHRMKTSENISHYRLEIVEKLRYVLDDKNIFERTVDGFMELEQIKDRNQAREELKNRILRTISSFKNYDEIAKEIDEKHTKYLSSSVARAKFLLNDSGNTDGKIFQILAVMADELNRQDDLGINEDADEDLLRIFEIFPQGFLDGDSLYVMPITRKNQVPQLLDESMGLSEEERLLRKLALRERHRNRFSRKNIDSFVMDSLGDNKTILASSLPLFTRRDIIRIIFISLYGRHHLSGFRIIKKGTVVEKNGFRFEDFEIERRDEDGRI